MRKFVVSPNPSSNFSNPSFLANKKEPDHSGLEPGQTLISALGGSAQLCSTILLPRTPLWGPQCPPSLSQIISPFRTPALGLASLDVIDGGSLHQSCILNGTSKEGGGKQEEKVGRFVVGPEQRTGKSGKEGLSPALLFPARRAQLPWLGDSEVTVKQLP